MNITGWFFSQGYKTEDLKSIKDGIELVGVKGDPTLSVDRLIRGIEEAGSLNNLRGTIKKSREELKTLQDEIVSAEGKLSAIQETVIKAIDKTKDNAVGQIENLGKNSVSDIGKLRDNVEKMVKDLEKTSEGSIGRLEESTETRIRDTTRKSCEDVEAVKKEAIKSLSGIHAEISAVGTRVSDSMKDVQALGLEDIEKVVEAVSRSVERNPEGKCRGARAAKGSAGGYRPSKG